MDSKELEKYWTNRYKEQNTGWDVGYATEPFQEFFKGLKDKNQKILIPGAGNSYEAEYLHKLGFKNVHVLDISRMPLLSLSERVPDFPKEHLLQQDFFEHRGSYDLVLEQTFFCSFEPTAENRKAYASKMYDLLNDNGRLVGLWFNHLVSSESKRPFGGSKEEYLGYLDPYFKVVTFEPCHNSIKPRLGNELFGIFQKRRR